MFLLMIYKSLKESLISQITVSFPIWSFRILTNFHIFGHRLIFHGEEKCCKLFQPIFQQGQYFSNFLRKVFLLCCFLTSPTNFFSSSSFILNLLMLSLTFLWDKSLLLYVTHEWWFHTWTILRSGFPLNYKMALRLSLLIEIFAYHIHGTGPHSSVIK